jgi:hypothetical protein
MAGKKVSRKRRISRKSDPRPAGQRMLSRGGWKLLLDESGVLRIRAPSGRVFTFRPGGHP